MVRGPYRRRPKLAVAEKKWHEEDVVTVGRVRWIIRHIGRDKTVELVSSNSTNHAITWKTTLDQLPMKASRR